MTTPTYTQSDMEALRERCAKAARDDANIFACLTMDETRDAVKIIIDAYLAKLTSTKAEPSRVAEIQALLLDEAKRHSDFTKSMQARRKAEYIERGETAPDYRGMESEETIYWEAATIITAIEADRDRLRGALENIADVKQGRMEPPSELIRRIKVYACAALNPSKPGEG